MAIIEPVEDCPPDFSAVQRACWEKSMVRWRLRYGYADDRMSHTAAYFGLVPIGIGLCWAWAQVIEKRPNFAMLTRGKLAFETVLHGRPWTIYAKCEDLRSKKFAEFLGFTHVGFDETDYLMRREPQ